MTAPRRPRAIAAVGFVILAAVALSLQPQASAQAVRGLTMAVTVDDLPYAYTPQEREDLRVAQSATGTMLRVLAQHRVPVTAFVNAGKLRVGGELSARTAILSQWVDAGFVLGNHTYSHADLNTLTIEEFQREILEGESAVRTAMASRGTYPWFFRYPHNHTGNTVEKKEAIVRFLTARGYQIAPHTIDPSDFIFNGALGVALDQNDQATAARLRSEYLDFAMAATSFAERVAPRILGEQVPQVLLIHASRLHADVLDELLTRYERRGYSFVSLNSVMAHPAYKTIDTSVTSFGPTWLWRWSTSKALPVSFRDDPDPPAWVMEMVSKTN